MAALAPTQSHITRRPHKSNHRLNPRRLEPKISPPGTGRRQGSSFGGTGPPLLHSSPASTTGLAVGRPVVSALVTSATLGSDPSSAKRRDGATVAHRVTARLLGAEISSSGPDPGEQLSVRGRSRGRVLLLAEQSFEPSGLVQFRELARPADSLWIRQGLLDEAAGPRLLATRIGRPRGPRDRGGQPR
jgi:hypothetical protein